MELDTNTVYHVRLNGYSYRGKSYDGVKATAKYRGFAVATPNCQFQGAFRVTFEDGHEVLAEQLELEFVADYEIGDLIQRKDDHDRWGICKGFSDDGSTVYYSPKGTSLSYVSTGIYEMELG